MNGLDACKIFLYGVNQGFANVVVSLVALLLPQPPRPRRALLFPHGKMRPLSELLRQRASSIHWVCPRDSLT